MSAFLERGEYMSGKKKIPCRVCGKLFDPCTYCQSHSDIFMWRNFACSIECARKYINDTIAYRESLKKKNDYTENHFEKSKESNLGDTIGKTTSKRKSAKKTPSVILVNKNEIIDKETE